MVACVSIKVAAVSPVTNFSFTLEIPAGHVPSVSPNFGGRFVSEVVVPSTGTSGSPQWAFNLTTRATNPLLGGELIGSICFTPTKLIRHLCR